MESNWGKLESVSSFDKHDVISYGDGTMGLAGDFITQLTRGEDGSIEKSSKTGMFSFGSKLMEINDISSFTAKDDQGHEYTTGLEKSVTLTNFDDPFILIKGDLVKISDVGSGVGSSSSEKYIFVPDTVSSDTINLLNEAFDSSDTQVKTFKYDDDLTKLFKEANIDLSLYFGQTSWDQLFGAFKNKEIWNIFLEGAKQQQDQKEAERDINTFFIDSKGGVTCKWGYENGVKL